MLSKSPEKPTEQLCLQHALPVVHSSSPCLSLVSMCSPHQKMPSIMLVCQACSSIHSPLYSGGNVPTICRATLAALQPAQQMVPLLTEVSRQTVVGNIQHLVSATVSLGSSVLHSNNQKLQFEC